VRRDCTVVLAREWGKASPKGVGWSLGTPDGLRGFQKLRTVSEESGNSGQDFKTPEGSGVDGKARGNRKEWKWIGSPLTSPPF